MSEQGTTEGLRWHWDVRAGDNRRVKVALGCQSRGQEKVWGGTGMSEQGTREGLGWHWDVRAGDKRRFGVALVCQRRDYSLGWHWDVKPPMYPSVHGAGVGS